MSWFQSTNLASFAKSALKEAQKTIDKALDIQEDQDKTKTNDPNKSSRTTNVGDTVSDIASDFLASWGVTGSKPPPSQSQDPSVSSPSREEVITSPCKSQSFSNPSNENAAADIESFDSPFIDNLISLEPEHSQDISKNEFQSVDFVNDVYTASSYPISSIEFNTSNSLSKIAQVDTALISVPVNDIPPRLCTNEDLTDVLHPTTSDLSQSVSLIHPNVEISSISLLQDIDLNGVDLINNEDSSMVPCSDPVFSSSSELTSAVILDSTLSEGWDWTSTPGLELNSESNKEQEQNPETGSANSNLECNESEEKVHANSSVEVGELSNPVQFEHVAQNDSVVMEKEENLELPDVAVELSTVSAVHHLVDQEPYDTGTPSSDRVSPNFEIVQNESTAASSNQPESSRSSSIVVVSGRESTPNSGGSGSSGSSEGGQDVEGEHLLSPASPPAPLELCGRKSKHEKGASSSSSDIEVIPSDYSGDSPKLGSTSTHASFSGVPRYVLPSCHMETQTVSAWNDMCVQTDKEPEPPHCSNPSDEKGILSEKNLEIQQLREEGEKLSVKQYELGQIIKKLRNKEKESDVMTKGLRTEIATKKLELEKLMKTFISKEGIEQSQNDTIAMLNQERSRLELQVEQLRSELEDAKDNENSMKATLENTSIEILELKNVISSVQRDSAEVDRLTREKGELISRCDSLGKELDHLRGVLNTNQNNHQCREAELKLQISQLTSKTHSFENQLSDISSEIADATMPLSMEIEKLQGELKQQQAQSDRREQNLSSIVSDLEEKLQASIEREKSAKTLQLQSQSNHSSLEFKVNELEVYNQSLIAQLANKEEHFQKQLCDKDTSCQKLSSDVKRLTGEVERLYSENNLLANELKTERTSFEVERRKSQTLVDQLNRVNHQGQQPHKANSMTSASSNQMHSRNSQNMRNDNSPRSRDRSPSENSIASENSYLDDVFDQNVGALMMNNGNNRSITPKSCFDSSYSTVGLIESLQNHLRLREGEVISFQEELNKNEKIRKQLNEEIASLTLQNQQLMVDMEKLSELEKRLVDLDKNYNAVLQMYGEKVEEADELRMDLEDVKEMYKTQIEQLLKKT